MSTDDSELNGLYVNQEKPSCDVSSRRQLQSKILIIHSFLREWLLVINIFSLSSIGLKVSETQVLLVDLVTSFLSLVGKL